MYKPIISAVNPISIVNAAEVRFKASLLVPLLGFSVAFNPARNYTFPTLKSRQFACDDGQLQVAALRFRGAAC